MEQESVVNIVKKSKDISGWYNSVVEQAKLAEHGPVKGTMVWRPNGYALWENAQKELDVRIKKLGVSNVYFPLFIPYDYFNKEADHIKGFSPELAIVTHGGGEELAEPIVVRPTSETIIFSYFSKWIHSFRDLPMKVNQWCNSVRWEKRFYYFLRTSEFLWQEGHTAHETFDDAQNMVMQVLSMYESFYKEHFALFGYVGEKSESEKFAGADSTYTYEVLMPDGKSVQACTSHNFGQNFAKAFDVKYQSRNGDLQYVWQTSWGLSNRSLGALVLAHGDDNGLILPPRVASVKCVVIPVLKSGSNNKALLSYAHRIEEKLTYLNITTRTDATEQSVGWKFNQYDLEGVPIRIEVGEKEFSSTQLKVVVRDNKEVITLNFEELHQISAILQLMQERLYEKTKDFTLKNTHEVATFDQFENIMKTSRGFIKAFWCENSECEEAIKEKTKATTRALPLDAIAEADKKCVYCGREARHKWIFAQAY